MNHERNAQAALPTARQIGTAIRTRRILKGLSQEQLGFSSDTHRTYIGALERGQKAITVEKLVKLAIALECTAWEILKDCGL